MSFPWIKQLGHGMKCGEREVCKVQISGHIRLGSLLASS